MKTLHTSFDLNAALANIDGLDALVICTVIGLAAAWLLRSVAYGGR